MYLNNAFINMVLWKFRTDVEKKSQFVYNSQNIMGKTLLIFNVTYILNVSICYILMQIIILMSFGEQL